MLTPTELSFQRKAREYLCRISTRRELIKNCYKNKGGNDIYNEE
jgi:hypothetical protein